MDHIQVWRSVCNQLELQIPTHIFRTQVLSLRPSALEEDLLVLDCPTAQTRDWASDRLAAIIRSMLVGVCAREMEVRFEIQAPSAPAGQVPVEHAPSPPAGNVREPEALPSPAESAAVAALPGSPEARIVRPESITAVPRYLLRWLPVLGFQRAWILVALYQSFYQAHGHKAAAGKRFSASAATLARWSGLSRPTVVRHLKALSSSASGSPLHAFVERLDASSYCFRSVMPLTPADSRFLGSLLADLGLQSDPAGALNQALALPASRLLPSACPPAAAESSPACLAAECVSEMVMRAAAWGEAGPEQTEALELARQLERKILAASDVLLIRHYFLLHWLKRLGSGPAWLVTLLRARGYHNPQTGEVRDQITLAGGFGPLAAELGLRRTQTITDWLPAFGHTRQGAPAKTAASNRWSDTRSQVGHFLTRLKPDGRAIKVRMDEPLIAEHRASNDPQPEASGCAMAGAEASRITKQREMDRPAADPGAACTASQREMDTPGAEQNANSSSSQRDVYTLKDFKPKHLIQAPITEPETLTHHQDSESTWAARRAAPGGARAGGGLREWDLNRLLQLGGTGKRRRDELCQKFSARPEIGLSMLAWLIYAHEHRKTHERSKGIQSPFGFAISRCERELPAAAYRQLASLAPAELLSLLQRNPYGHWDVPLVLRNLVLALSDSGLQELLEELCGQPASVGHRAGSHR